MKPLVPVRSRVKYFLVLPWTGMTRVSKAEFDAVRETPVRR